MDELELTEELRLSITSWMTNKYSVSTIQSNIVYLKRLFKEHKVLNKQVIKNLVKKYKHQYQRALLVMIVRYCDENDIPFTPTIPSIKKSPSKVPDILSSHEIKLMVDSAPKPYDLAIRCIFNMGSGLRISEVIKLSWSHIRWVDWLHNKENYGVVVIKSGKGSVDRVVNIPSKLMNDLYEYAKEKDVLNEFGIPTGGMIFPFNEYPPTWKRKRRQDYLNHNDIDDTWKYFYVKNRYDWFRHNILKKHCEKALGKRIKIHSLRHCVSSDTKILTVHGWKSYNELNEGETILNYNMITNSIEQDMVSSIYTEHYDGDLVHIKNRYIDSLITDEHKIPIREITPNKKGTFMLKRFKDINLKSWNLSYLLSGKIRNSKRTIGKHKSGILGFILSDGSIKRPSSTDITISQSKKANRDKCQYLKKLLDNAKIPYTIKERSKGMLEYRILKGGNHSRHNKGKNHAWIFEYIYFDRTPIFHKILNLNYDELSELYKCMMLGDGTRRKRNPEYTNQHKKRIDLIRILCCILGHTSVQGYKLQEGKIYSRVYICDGKNHTQINTQKKHITSKRYRGVIWCPTTKNGTFIAKRNETIFITGNSRATYLYEYEKVPIERIQLLLGHKDLSTTMIYTKVNPHSTFEMLKETQEI